LADVFISYSKSRQKETVDLAADLQRRGFTVWWDTDLTPGEKFRDVINVELGRARAAIVIWTPESVKSDWVISEAERARRRGILIAVYTADLRLDDIPQPFDILHSTLVTDRPAIFNALAKMGIGPSSDAKVSDPITQKRKDGVRARSGSLSRRAAIVGGGLIAAGAVGAGGFAYRRVARAPAQTSSPVQKMTGHIGAVSAVAYTVDGRGLISGSWDHTLKRWELGKENSIFSYDGHANVAYCVAMLTNAHQALSGGDDGLMKLWDLNNPHAVRSYSGQNGEIWSIATMPDGESALSSGLGGAMKLWNLEETTVVRTFQYGSRVLAVAIVPGGQFAVSTAKNVLQSWSIADASKIRQFNGHNGDVKAIAPLPNGKQVLSGGDDMMIKLWDLSSENALANFPGHEGKVNAVAVSPNGRTAFSGSDDMSAKLWDLTNGKVIRSFDHGDAVESVAISPDGRTAVTGGRNAEIKLWSLT
jgi:hypothetical protein